MFMIEEKVLKSFAGKSVLVTGGIGLIGRQIVNVLCEVDSKVKIVSLDKIRVNDKAEHIFGDLTSFEFCKDITKEMDFVFHYNPTTTLLDGLKETWNWFVKIRMNT